MASSAGGRSGSSRRRRPSLPPFRPFGSVAADPSGTDRILTQWPPRRTGPKRYLWVPPEVLVAVRRAPPERAIGARAGAGILPRARPPGLACAPPTPAFRRGPPAARPLGPFPAPRPPARNCTPSMLDRLLGLFSRDIGIDLGTANTLVHVRDRGHRHLGAVGGRHRRQDQARARDRRRGEADGGPDARRRSSRSARSATGSSATST